MISAIRAGLLLAALAGQPVLVQDQSPIATTTARPPAGAQRVGHTTTILTDGTVLLVGGRTETTNGLVWMPMASRFDPSVGRISASGDLVELRERHTATRLADGRVLIIGGSGPASPALASAEIYDPATGRFTATGPMRRPRVSPEASLQPDGKVLIRGGEVPAVRSPTTETFDPKTGHFR